MLLLTKALARRNLSVFKDKEVKVPEVGWVLNEGPEGRELRLELGDIITSTTKDDLLNARGSDLMSIYLRLVRPDIHSARENSPSVVALNCQAIMRANMSSISTPISLKNCWMPSPPTTPVSWSAEWFSAATTKRGSWEGDSMYRNRFRIAEQSLPDLQACRSIWLPQRKHRDWQSSCHMRPPDSSLTA